jgi:hypothetical protein|tara:strand:+ start:163 stop:312 length:150 start_codon:yes stop_codon:yes gene_type:complete
MELKSPDGSTKIKAHPSKVKSFLARGWEPVNQVKPKAKNAKALPHKEVT